MSGYKDDYLKINIFQRHFNPFCTRNLYTWKQVRKIVKLPQWNICALVVQLFTF